MKFKLEKQPKTNPKTRIIRFLERNEKKKFKTLEIAKRLKINRRYVGRYMGRIRGFFGIHSERRGKDMFYWYSKRRYK